MLTEIAKSEYQPGEYIAKRYEVKRALGKGGMGMVYLVVDHKTGEPMALKTIRPSTAAMRCAGLAAKSAPSAN